MHKALITLTVILTAGCASACQSMDIPPLPLVDAKSHSPSLQLDMRYAGPDNFTGKRVSGYNAAKCLLQAPVAEALAAVEQGLRSGGYGLLIYDCYRPTVAVADFMVWANDLQDQRSKARYYPDLDKSQLVPDYIADKSGHSKGATVDVGLLDCRRRVCKVLDMGTAFDFFGTKAHTANPNLSKRQTKNRARLLRAMAEHGFSNYPLEWWHYTWKSGPLPDTAYDFSID